MVPNAEVFDLSMPTVVLHELASGVVVAIEGCCIKNGHVVDYSIITNYCYTMKLIASVAQIDAATEICLKMENRETV